jgi:high affinity choline transporter 7
MWVMSGAIVCVGAAATALAITVDSIYGLWYLCSDLVYVILFPQLLCCVHIPFTNTYGSILGFILGLVFRFTGGEPLLSLPPAIEYPWYDAASGYQCFPFKTMSMLICLVSIIAGSYIARALFRKGILPPSLDIAGALPYTTGATFENKEMVDIPDGKEGKFVGYDNTAVNNFT